MASGVRLVRLCTEYLRPSSWRNVSMAFPAPLVRHLSNSANVSQQVVARDQKSIICYHPPTNVSYQHTKPLRKQKVWGKHSLTEEEVTVVRRLRKEDGSIWSLGTLSRLFKVSPATISRVAPASEERQREVGEEREMLRNMRRHKRKLYLLQRQEVRRSKLKELLASKTLPTTTEPPVQ